MKITKQALENAAEAQIISHKQATALYAYLTAQTQHIPAFTFTHVLYYMGGLIAIGAMTLFMNLGWEAFGGAGIVFISVLYAVAGLTLTHYFSNKGLTIPAGICATFIICLTPLAIYGFQLWLGVWPDDTEYRSYHRYIKWHWLYMELGTLAVGAILAWKYKYPFMLMPIAVTLWYMTMDIAVMLTGGDNAWELRKLVSMYTGLLMIGLACWIDLRTRSSADFAFWIYIFGVLAFWCGLSFQYSESELSKFIYFCINLLIIGCGVLLGRRVFVVFGALGSCGYLGYLASDVFEDSWLFPIVLTAIGLGVISLGVLWQKHESRITQWARTKLPTSLQERLKQRN